MMPIPLDQITYKKLVLVRQLYQRAILQGEVQHSYVDRIMSLIGLDLTNETVLKAVVGALLPNEQPKTEFQTVLRQANDALIARGLAPVPDQVNIQHVRTLRNDAQHKARYPNDSDVNDCRTYTRDFLKRLIENTWGKDFESISLVETISNQKIRGYLEEAQDELAKGDYATTVIKTLAALGWTFRNVKSSLAGSVPRDIETIFVGDGFGNQWESQELFRVFENVRHTLMRSVVGLGFAASRRYFGMARRVGAVIFMADGNYEVNHMGYVPTLKEAEFSIEFATSSILQIESLVGDIENPFEF